MQIIRGFSSSAAIIIAGFAVISFVFSIQQAKAAIFEPGFETEVVAGGLNLPTNMAFSPDGRIFIAEKNGVVRLIKNGVLQPTPVVTLSDINTFGDRGLLSVELDPSFLTNGYLYLAYTFENTPGANFTGTKMGRIVRLTVVGDTASEATKVVLVGTVGGNAATPSCKDYATTSDCIPSDSPSHSVGALRFGPDGKLYASLGDGAHFDFTDPDSKRAQVIDSLGGKILRINKDGTAPSDNPFYNGDPNANRSKVFAFGFRNAYRLNFGPGGALFAGDVGWGSWEEVNKVTAGGNYGWPCWEGNVTTLHNCSASTANTAPLYTYAHDANGAGAVAAGTFPKNSAYPAAYNTSFFFGDYAQNWIKRIVVDANNTFVSIQNFMDNPDGPVDLSTGPDGNVYYLSIYTGELHRITHTAGNRRPVPVLSGTPSSGSVPLIVAFSSAGSNDPDGDALSYLWNFGDGTSSTTPNPTKTYITAGTYSASLTLTDSKGANAAKSITITAGNQAPTAGITSPATGSLYSAFQMIQVVGTANDPETGALPASAYHFDIILHHNTHIHIIQQFDATTSPSFVAPDHNDTDVYLEVKLTVTDPANLTGTKSINMYISNGATNGNLVANPSMELADVGVSRPQQWQTSVYGVHNASFTYPAPGIDGAKAAKVDITNYADGAAKWYFEPVSVTAGATYNFSSWYISNVATVLHVQYELPGGVFQYEFLGDIAPAGSATKITRTLTIPANVQRVSLFHDLMRVGSLTTDNFSLMLAGAGDTTAPTVSITSPAASSTLAGTNTVSMAAADNVGVVGVAVFVDGNQVGVEDTAAPYDFVWNTRTFSNGSHTLTARARDAAGNVTNSSAVLVGLNNNLILNGSFEVVNGANPLGWTADAWGTHTQVFTYPIVGFDGNKGVEAKITSYTPTDTGDTGWRFAEVPVTPGVEYTYSERYKATTISDVIGRYTFADGSEHFFGLTKELPASATWRFNSGKFVPPLNTVSVTLRHLISTEATLSLDDTWMFVSGTGIPSEIVPPVVTWISPSASSTVSGTITLNANATDNVGVAGLFFAVDGTPISGEYATGPYTMQWDTTGYSNGPHVLKATARDAVGNNSATSIVVFVDNSGSGSNIANGSVETAGAGGDPQSWLRGGWGNNTATYAYPVTGIVGAKAIRVAISAYTDGDAKWYFAEIPAPSGSARTVTHRYKSNIPSDMFARFTMPGGTYQYQYLSTKPVSAAWGFSTTTATLPATATAFTLFHIIAGVGFLETDDFVLLGSGTTTPPTPFVYTLSNAGNRTVVQGQATTSLITATLSSGTGAAVNFSISALPSGVTSSFSQTSCTPTCTTTLTFTASGSATVGTTPVTVSSVSGTTTKTTIFNLTVQVAPVVPPTANNLILNPSLETANGAVPASWATDVWGTTAATFTYPTGGAQNGSRYVKTQITTAGTGDAKWSPDAIATTPGKTYTFSDYYQSTATSYVEIEYLLSTGAYQYVLLDTLTAQAGWTQYQKTFTTPANAQSMTIFHYIKAAATLSVDNYTLTLQP